MKRTEWFKYTEYKPVYTGWYEVTTVPEVYAKYPTQVPARVWYHAGMAEFQSRNPNRTVTPYNYANLHWRGVDKEAVREQGLRAAKEKNPLIKPTRESELYTRLFRMRDALEQLKEHARCIVAAVDRTLDEKYP